MQAPKGSMIIQAADKAGVAIPRFCYHEKLPIAANCRMCLVDVEKMPKPAPACATPVMEGMKVTTQTKRALDSQRNVMEFLLVNHPLDCPVCDQGGECELQDVALGYGRSVSRYVERKRVVADEDLGSLVATEMTRCIHCTRCVRFTADVAGTYELGGMYRGENLQIGTYDGKPLMTELSGNVVDVCPVGALTNKVFRFRARPWELTAREGVATHDALGSNLFHHVRRGEILRSVPRDNESVNECWLSDRDRYSHQGLYAQDRAKQPKIKENGQWREVSWSDALERAGGVIKATAAREMGVLAHPATSNEEGVLLARMADALGIENIDHRLNQIDASDAAQATVFDVPVAQMEQADLFVIVGCNIRHELPLVHARMLKASKQGAKVVVINPVDFSFSFSVNHKSIVKPSQLPGSLAALAAELGAPTHVAAISNPETAAMAALIKSAERPVLVLGEIAEAHPQAASLRALAAAMSAHSALKINRIPQGANAVGLSQQGLVPSGQGLSARAMLASSLKTYVLFGIEPEYDLGLSSDHVQALAAATVVAFTAYESESLLEIADVILPIAANAEIDGSYTNLDGQVQLSRAAGKAPGEARSGWRILRALGEQLAIDGFDFMDLDSLRQSMSPKHKNANPSAAPGLSNANSGFERISTTPIYRADAQLRRSTALNEHPLTRGAGAVLHPEDAMALGFKEGMIVKVSDSSGKASMPLRLNAGLARGCVWIENGYNATAALRTFGHVEISGGGA